MPFIIQDRIKYQKCLSLIARTNQHQYIDGPEPAKCKRKMRIPDMLHLSISTKDTINARLLSL